MTIFWILGIVSTLVLVGCMGYVSYGVYQLAKVFVDSLINPIFNPQRGL